MNKIVSHECSVCGEVIETTDNIICTMCAEYRIEELKERMKTLYPSDLQKSTELLDAVNMLLFFNPNHE